MPEITETQIKTKFTKAKTYSELVNALQSLYEWDAAAIKKNEEVRNKLVCHYFKAKKRVEELTENSKQFVVHKD